MRLQRGKHMSNANKSGDRNVDNQFTAYEQKIAAEVHAAVESGSFVMDRNPYAPETIRMIAASAQKKEGLKAFVKAQEESGEEVRYSYEALMYNPTMRDGVLYLYFYDVIAPWWGLSAIGYQECIGSVSADTKVVNVFGCPGGGVFEARAIANTVTEEVGRGREMDAINRSLTASAATYIFLKFENRYLEDGTMFMMHRCWGLTIGNGPEMIRQGELCMKIDLQIARNYAAVSDEDADFFLVKMDEETWLTEQEAAEYGFGIVVDASEEEAPAAVEEQEEEAEPENKVEQPTDTPEKEGPEAEVEEEPADDKGEDLNATKPTKEELDAMFAERRR